jgi:ADP-ribose pyrophosphatase YjhB (NUDIX family)
VSPRPRAREEVSAGGVVFRCVPDAAGAPRPMFLLIRDSYRNWGLPKGHLEAGEGPECAALREVAEETGLGELAVEGQIEVIDWYFRFRGRLIHKVCHFYLMRTDRTDTCPQRSEGITACRWAAFEEAVTLVSYANAREVLRRAQQMVCELVPLVGQGARRDAPEAADARAPGALVASASQRSADAPPFRGAAPARSATAGERTPSSPDSDPTR